MKKQDITQYGDSELSLIIQNDEALYNEWNKAIRWGNFKPVQDFIDEVFIYTGAQLEEAMSDFYAECEEEEN